MADPNTITVGDCAVQAAAALLDARTNPSVDRQHALIAIADGWTRLLHTMADAQLFRAEATTPEAACQAQEEPPPAGEAEPPVSPPLTIQFHRVGEDPLADAVLFSLRAAVRR